MEEGRELLTWNRRYALNRRPKNYFTCKVGLLAQNEF